MMDTNKVVIRASDVPKLLRELRRFRGTKLVDALAKVQGAARHATQRRTHAQIARFDTALQPAARKPSARSMALQRELTPQRRTASGRTQEQIAAWDKELREAR
jgi:hypothetical protein